MKALAHDIRKLLADRIQVASASDLFAIAIQALGAGH